VGAFCETVRLPQDIEGWSQQFINGNRLVCQIINPNLWKQDLVPLGFDDRFAAVSTGDGKLKSA
jgi:hypothetical protein